MVVPIKRKNKVMLQVEQKFGEPLEETLRKLYVDEDLNLKQIEQRLGVSYVTIISWLKKSGIYGKRLNLFNED